MVTLSEQRVRMVERHIASQGVRDSRVLAAMAEVPREDFVPVAMRKHAYDDAALPIEEEQTISQPYIVAVMIEALHLEPGDRVLEIGAGSGYAAAVLSRIVREVFAVERYRSLVDLARARVRALGYENVELITADGTRGLPEHAPYDAILVSAGAPAVPESLLEQLKIGGRLVIPVGEEVHTQQLLCLRRSGEHEVERESLCPVRFVPLIGSEGWAEDL